MNKIIKAEYKCYTRGTYLREIQIFREIQRVFRINKKRNENDTFETSAMRSWDQIKKKKAVNLRINISVIREQIESIEKVHWDEFKKKIH